MLNKNMPRLASSEEEVVSSSEEELQTKNYKLPTTHYKLTLALVLVVMLVATVSAERMPLVNGDSGDWGTVLNDYLNVSHNDSGEISVDSITFKLGEMIDNLVDGFVRITGGLNVTGDLVVNNSVLFVNSTSGNVGIGTSSPWAQSHISGSSGAQLKIDVATGNINDYTGIAFGDYGGASGEQDIYSEIRSVLTNTGDTALTFLTTTGGAGSQTEQVRIDHSGNVGIGTTAPTGALDVTGSDVRFYLDDSSSTNQALMTFQDDGTAKWSIGKDSNNHFTFYDNVAGRNAIKAESNGNLLLQSTNGNVGIGTTAPNAKLDVNASSGTSVNIQGGDVIIDLSD